MYKYQTVIRLGHTDSAGIVFFTSLFELAHECYESFLAPDLSLASIIEQGEFLMPIVHAQADYRTPIKLGEKFTIEMSLNKTGTTSFELGYTFINESSKIAAEVNIIHVVLQMNTWKPIEIPENLKTILSNLTP